MKTWIYAWVIYPLVYSIAMLIGFFNKKVRDTLRLRSWKDFLSLRFNAGQPIEYWVHVASQGELEYALPILQELNRRSKRVLVTYYSISAKSGVEKLPSFLPNVSLVVPIPHDGLGLMREFVRLVRAQGVRTLLLLKYELWPGMLWECNAQEVAVVLVDALKPGWFHLRLLHKLSGIVAGYDSEIKSIEHPKLAVLGDTRVERVIERLQQSTGNVVQKDTRAVVFGSMWCKDSQLMLDALEHSFHDDLHLIWVPHELELAKAESVEKKLKKLGFQTRWAETLQDIQRPGLSRGKLATIVFKKGFLAEAYRGASMAYVGGGFGSGVHSVWEPALAGARVACGTERERSPESYQLEKGGVLTVVSNAEELTRWLRENFGKAEVKPLDQMVSEHLGASKRIIDWCEAEF